MTRTELVNIILRLEDLGNVITLEEQIENLDWVLEDQQRALILWSKNVELSYNTIEGLKLKIVSKGEVTEEYIEELNRLYKIYNDMN